MANAYILLNDLKEFVNKPVTLKGWLYNQRSSGKIAFLQFRDGTGTIQAVAMKDHLTSDCWQAIQSLTLESSVVIEGIVKQEQRAPTGYELTLTDLQIIQLASSDYPIGKKTHGVSFLLNNRHLWLRSSKEQAILQVRNQVIIAMRQFYEQNHFIEIATPIFSPVACEGTTTLFQVDYFGEPAYLSQSGQLYLEACLPGFNRVYDFQPVFRAEKSKTRRHLTEFWMSNVEAAFTDHSQNLDFQEKLIFHILQHILTHCQQDLNTLERNVTPLEKIKLPFIRRTHKEVVKELQTLGSSLTVNDDLGAEDEFLLMQHYDQPVFVEYYPAAVKAFYMKRWEKDLSKAKCADLLAPEGRGEIIGGSERETDYVLLKQSMEDHQLPVSEYQWYLDQRRYGSVPHSGFGVGIERLVAWITGIHHVRRAITFPRTLNRLRPEITLLKLW